MIGKVYNNTNSSMILVYNKKLAFDSDVKSWSGLKDLVNVTIAANSFTTVSISTNFLAKAMAFCQVNVNDSVRTRYITYCNDISNVNVRMSIFKIRKVENIV